MSNDKSMILEPIRNTLICLLLVVKLEDIEMKYEALSSDNEYDFQFVIDDQEYDEVLKELKAKDDDQDVENEIKIACPHSGCKKAFSRNHNLMKHLKTHDLGLERPYCICHICGKTIRGVYSLHLKIHQNIKQFNCEDCGRSFRQKVALHNHSNNEWDLSKKILLNWSIYFIYSLSVDS